MQGTFRALLAIGMLAALPPVAWPQAANGSPSSALIDAQHHFYSGRYETAAALALEARSTDPAGLAASELRSSALLFQIRRAFGEPSNDVDRKKSWNACALCQELLSVFLTETSSGRALAHARLAVDPADEVALYFLGKLDLNYVWLHVGTLGQKTGWGEYWEARKSLDKVLESNPDHVRARVARAWIDYIVDTKAPWGTKWLLGGGSRKRGLRMVQEAARIEGDPFAQAEAMFALWDMQVREKNLAGAVATARALRREFPENRELARFIDAQARNTLTRSQAPGARAYDDSTR